VVNTDTYREAVIWFWYAVCVIWHTDTPQTKTGIYRFELKSALSKPDLSPF